MHKARLAEKILKNLNTAVLVREAPGQYSFLGEAPPFYNRIFPQDADTGGPCTTPWRHSSMLDFFFQMAEEFFAGGSEGMISSGTWEEDNICEIDQAMVAEAMSFPGAEVITVRLLTDAYAERVALLHAVRSELLERRILHNDLEEYKLKSTIDGLTGVLNRTAFMEELRVRLQGDGEAVPPCALIMIDIDHFKRVNDTYGHQSGDLVLIDMGRILLGKVRRGKDLVARYGGEEFIVMVQTRNQRAVFGIAEKLRISVAGHSFGSLPRITASFGCTVHVPGESIEETIRRADEALYDAKGSGRNCVRAHWPKINSS
ncbi:MAG: GGDEF domain-containing protein [Desulfovibrio sp.]|jgi:diguanylate cyclase (GGDEF)-like protein|nr:GGDEF domain-containing protein [Desulfovibrio sp.]